MKDAKTFWEIVSADAQVADYTVDPKAGLLRRLLHVRRAMRHRIGFACVFWLRVNQYMIARNWRGHYRLRIWRNYRFANDISPYARIGPGLLLPHPVDVTVGGAAVLGSQVSLYNGVSLASKRQGGDSAMPTLGDQVIIYTGAKLFGGITIGKNTEIGALCLCNKNVPEHSVVYGIPPTLTIKPKPEQ